jgi:hypothetical protein
LYETPENENSVEATGYYNLRGENSSNHRHNLVNVPVVRHEYLNINTKDEYQTILRHNSEFEADQRLKVLGKPSKKFHRIKLTYKDDVLTDVALVEINS